MDHSRRLIVALATAVALGIGAIVLQRWVAQTFSVAVALVAIWFGLILVAALVLLRTRPDLRNAALVSIALVGVISAVAGYWTGIRKNEVDEQVVVASERADEEERMVALAGMDMSAEQVKRQAEPKPTGPVELAAGLVAGADGHAGEGKATVIEEGGERTLTLTEFDVDAGPDVNVYLSTSTAGIDDAVDLGDLKGERGDQQYEIPSGLDLTKYDDLVLWCIPFTTRIATAELR